MDLKTKMAMNLSKIDYDYYHDTYNYYFVISGNLEGHYI